MNVIELYRNGDVIRLTKGDLIVQAPVIDNGIDYPYLDMPGHEKYLELRNIIAEGWAIDIIKKATIPVPTQPGIYRDNEGDFWVLDEEWYFYSLDSRGNNPKPTVNQIYFPLVRLEEVSE